MLPGRPSLLHGLPGLPALLCATEQSNAFTFKLCGKNLIRRKLD
jgi:hypothetical protein